MQSTYIRTVVCRTYLLFFYSYIPYLSNGAAIDGDPVPLAQTLKGKGVTILACLLTSEAINQPRQLQSPDTAT